MLRMRAFVSRSTGPSNSCCQSQFGYGANSQGKKEKKRINGGNVNGAEVI